MKRPLILPKAAKIIIFVILQPKNGRMIEFKSISPDAKPLFESFYKAKRVQNAESSLANLCAYSFLYHGEYAVVENCLVTRIHYEYGKEICYHFPIGLDNHQKVLEQLIEDAAKQNYQMCLICENATMPIGIREHFDFEAKRDFFDYLYLREDLQSLKGKKYQPKRNHINKFKALYDWSFEKVSDKTKSECLAFEDEWMRDAVSKNPEFEKDYLNERKVIAYLLENYESLGIFGGIIRVGGKIVAFSLGSSINNDTFDTHIEKASREFEGAFSIINQQMAEHLPANFVYINREEDLGLEGLRKAKQSYHPVRLVEKYIATLHK